MKKIATLSILFFSITAVSFSQDFNLGFGGGFVSDFSFPAMNSITIETPPVTVKTEAKNENTSFGGFIFFDATYVEANFSFIFGLPYSTVTTTTTGLGPTTLWADNSEGTSIALEVGVLGKYPFILGRFAVFPLLGVNYQHVLYMKIENAVADNPQDASTFGFQGGLGTDFRVAEKLFLRGELLYSIRLPNKQTTKAYGDGEVNLEHGIRFKLGIGYSF